MTTNDFDSSSGDELDIIYNMVYVFPIEFDHVIEVAEEESGWLGE